MQFHELACSFMSMHAVSWACMQFQDLLCSYRLRLSSSQEFRSACLKYIVFFVELGGGSDATNVTFLLKASLKFLLKHIVNLFGFSYAMF